MKMLKACLIIVVIIILSLPAGCSAQPGQPVVETQPVDEGMFSSMVSATGVVAPARWSRLSMPVPGLVAEVRVQAGDRVEAGAVLVRLSGGDPQNPAPELLSAVRGAELELASAQQAYEQLEPQASAALIQARQALAAAVRQVRDLQYQLEDLDVPGEQAAQTPLDAYGQAKADYTSAWKAFFPFKDEPDYDSEREDREETLEDAREAYETAIQRLQLNQQLAAAQAGQDQARADLLAYEDGPRPADVALAQARIERAQAAVDAARQSIDSFSLLAPFAGTVTEVLVRPGEYAAPGLAVLVLADLDQLWIETTDLNEIDMARIQAGSPATITFDALPDLVLNGQVVFVAPAASAGAGVNYKALIQLDALPERLRWGMSAFVDIVPDDLPEESGQ